MMHFPRFAGFDDDADSRARMLVDQMVMNGADGDECADRHVVLIDCAVGQNDELVAFIDRARRLCADSIQSLQQPSRPEPLGNVMSIVCERHPRWSMCLSAVNSAFESIGCGMRSRWALAWVGCSRFCSGPI